MPNDESAEKPVTGSPRVWVWLCGYFLVAAWWFGVKLYEQHLEHQRERVELERAAQEARDAVRRGEAGEAMRRLFPDEHQAFLRNQRQE